jgi:hypothetical protein
MGPGDVFGLLIALLIPTVFLIYVFRRWFSYKEKQLELNSRAAAERAAEYAASNKELEQRVRVLEQIVTDSGAQTAAQIEALRQARPRAIGGDKAPTNDAAA